MFTPYFKIDSILSIPSVTPAVADGDGAGFVYTYDNGSTFRKIDIANNFITSYSVTPSTANIGTFCVISGSAVLLSTTAGNWDTIELATAYKTQATLANSQCWTGYKAQQMAAQSGSALATNTGNRIFKFDAATNTGSLLTPAWLNTNITTVLANPVRGTFFVGSATGVVVEINSSMNVIGGLTLPTTPNDGTAQTLIVTGLSYYSDILVVSTLVGLTYVYQWSTKTLLSRSLGYVNTSNNSTSGFGASAGGGGLTLCAAPSGVMVAAPGCDNGGSGSSFQPVFLGSISASGFDYEDYLNVSAVGQKVIYTGVDHTYNKGWAMFRTNSAGNFVTFDIPSAELATVDSRSQFPVGTDITYREVFVKYNGPGRSRVIKDITFPAGANSFQVRKNARYIGITISGSDYDFRGVDT